MDEERNDITGELEFAYLTFFVYINLGEKSADQSPQAKKRKTGFFLMLYILLKVFFYILIARVPFFHSYHFIAKLGISHSCPWRICQSTRRFRGIGSNA